jgi:hypothetical protein
MYEQHPAPIMEGIRRAFLDPHDGTLVALSITRCAAFVCFFHRQGHCDPY